MSTDERRERDVQLRSYYAREVTTRAAYTHDERRTTLRSEFIELLRQEQRRTVLEIGCGTGQDGQALVDAGLTYTGVDLTPESVTFCRSKGLEATVASATELPFSDAAFDAAWSMSTLMHLAPDDQQRALREAARVLRPGSPLTVGVWGADAPSEQLRTTDLGERYFALTDDDTLRDRLGQIGTIERFRTWPRQDGRHYQLAVVRIPRN